MNNLDKLFCIMFINVLISPILLRVQFKKNSFQHFYNYFYIITVKRKRMQPANLQFD